ncbi:hypothetical protein AK812_SmicGene3016 [Symbiodinium microadriaticum]|uniref:Endonuclease/exonuclease/phosphatase domain-containing protein n=1 Tax=Symbiodinium microadriaticum TaxID=2951 RepID=A0A1Q9F014_SYMMI|nr:hypothetical protein AK812_SmicGene3016 [Symbiodinium microadriaticum]
MVGVDVDASNQHPRWQFQLALPLRDPEMLPCTGVDSGTKGPHKLLARMRGGSAMPFCGSSNSGLDLETIREPFWEQLQDHVSNIPQPEPVVVTGDFNVRFQAKHRNDGHCLGPFVYGKGPSFIDHSASSNRTLCRSFLQHQNMVEAASYKTPDLLKHITYRDKAAPPSDWSQFVLDPIPLQQIYTKLEARLGELALDVSSKAQADGVLPNRRRDGDFAIILERPTPTTKGTSALTHWLTEGKHRLDFFRPGATERSEGGDRSKASEVGNHTSLLQESRSDEFAAQLKLRPHLFDPSPDLGPFKLEELQQVPVLRCMSFVAGALGSRNIEPGEIQGTGAEYVPEGGQRDYIVTGRSLQSAGRPRPLPSP